MQRALSRQPAEPVVSSAGSAAIEAMTDPLHPMHQQLLSRMTMLPEAPVDTLPLPARTVIFVSAALAAWAGVVGLVWGIVALA